eukprot:GFUD01061591.1.p1 GENE.GFUD01061591.1~~GFUD01061591.1.p1  ORF type:complete len:286 (+),score=101.96 GFUD01061591.1:71-928(+)
MGVKHSAPTHLNLLDLPHDVLLLDLPHDVLLLLCNYLPLQDLPNLSRSCTHLNLLVGQHLDHLTSVKMISSWARFLSTNTGLLTQMESLVDHVRKKEDLMGRKDMYRLLHIRPDKMEEVRRVSCAEERVTFIGRDSPDKVEVRDELCRKVVRVDRVRWLQVEYKWSEVKLGRYRVSVRIRVEDNFTWPHTEHQPTVWTVGFPVEEGEEDIVVGVDRAWWRHLRKSKTLGGRLLVEKEGLGKWVRVVLPEVNVKRVGVVQVKVRDTVCNWWKGGLSFDFLELRRVG